MKYLFKDALQRLIQYAASKLMYWSDAMLQQEFSSHEARLILACMRMSEVLRSNPNFRRASDHLASISRTLQLSPSWDEKAVAAGGIRALFHKDSFAEQQPPQEAASWDQDIRTLQELCYIYVESRYRSLRFAQQDIKTDDGHAMVLEVNMVNNGDGSTNQKLGTARTSRCMLVVGLVVVAIFAVFIPLLPNIFVPKRWRDIRPGQDRAAVRAVLGVPDADYSEKSFDGWHNQFGFGASVIIVCYDKNLAKVVAVKIETKWGTEYRGWTQEYKKILE